MDNAAANGLSGRFRVIHGDFNRIHAGITNVQTVFCNPPFFKAGQGRVSPDPTIRLARFEIALNLADLLRGCSADPGPAGKSLPDLSLCPAGANCWPRPPPTAFSRPRLRPVQPFADSAPDRFLVQLSKARKTCRHQEPLVIFQGKGVYTPEMERLLAGE